MKNFEILKRFGAQLNERIGDNRGAAAIEYGLLAASISVTIITAVQYLGANLKVFFNTVANAI